MLFCGYACVFSTKNDAQYGSIGRFWEEMSALYGMEELLGLGFHWTEDTIEYVIGKKDGSRPEKGCTGAGAVYKEIELPETGWCTVLGRTEALSQLYEGIYADGVLTEEIEEFFQDGSCRIRYRRAAHRHGLHAAGAEEMLHHIAARRSYRGAYLPCPVPREDLAAIMRAGCDAPSGCNKQTTSMIGVDDPVLVKQVLSLIDPPVAQTAPALILVVTQRICAYRDRCFAVHDYAAAIQNMLLMISAMGYASCWYEGHITDTDRICDKIAALLHVPEGKEIVCLLPVGVPAGEAVAPKKRPYDERMCFAP